MAPAGSLLMVPIALQPTTMHAIRKIVGYFISIKASAHQSENNYTQGTN